MEIHDGPAKMIRQFIRATRGPNEHVKFAIKSETETNVWYVLLGNFSGDNDEYKGGEYLCEMFAPDYNIYKPPEFYMLTPNGVYDINGTVCVSIGTFHKEQYQKTLGWGGFSYQLVSGMVGWKQLGSGIRLLNTTINTKKTYAQNSKKFNAEYYPEIMKLIEESYETYSKNWANVG